jgi:hypothetical protein
MEKSLLVKINFNSVEINERREKVRERITVSSNNIKNGTITKVSEEDLKIIFNHYDTYFLNNYFGDNFIGNIKFSFSKRMTRSAGLTIVPKNIAYLKQSEETYEIRMGINFFLRYYDTVGEKKVNGLVTNDALHALQLVFEHELCHVIEFYVFKNSNCKKQRFQYISKNIFGHEGVYHGLPTNSEIAKEKYGIKIGDKVCFSYENKEFQGFISAIKKRATVMVLDKAGKYVDGKGNKYSKWYVALKAIF